METASDHRPRVRPGADDSPAFRGEPAHIPRVAAHIDAAEADLRARVLELRRRGVTWRRGGEALGITRRSAWERFSGAE